MSTSTEIHDPPPDLLTPAECRKLLGGIGERKLKDLIEHHGLPVLTLGFDGCGRGRRRLFLRSAVLAWIEGRRQATRAKGVPRGRAKPVTGVTAARGHRGGGAVRGEGGWEL